MAAGLAQSARLSFFDDRPMIDRSGQLPAYRPPQGPQYGAPYGAPPPEPAYGRPYDTGRGGPAYQEPPPRHQDAEAPRDGTFSMREIRDAGHGFFGSLSAFFGFPALGFLELLPTLRLGFPRCTTSSRPSRRTRGRSARWA